MQRSHRGSSQSSWFELGLYALVGALSVGLAFFLSTSFIVRGRAQAPISAHLATGATPVDSDKNRAPVFDEALVKRIAEDPDLLKKSLSDYVYESKGKKDPFQPFFGNVDVPIGDAVGPITYLQRYELSKLKLIGIIWDVTRPKAMILDPSGNVHVVEVNAKIGRNNAYVAAIREGEIVIVEPFDDGGKKSYTTKVIAIGKAD